MFAALVQGVEPPGVLSADVVLERPDQATVLFEVSPTPQASAVRVFVPVAEGADQAGWGLVLAGLLADRAHGAAYRVGVELDVERTATGIAYTAWGADADFDHIVEVMAGALAEPAFDALSVRRAARAAEVSGEPSRETGPGWIRTTLLEQACTGTTAWLGTPQTLGDASPEGLRALWARTHGTGRVTVTVVSRLPRAVLLAGLDELPAFSSGSSAASDTSDAVRRPGGRPEQLLRRWTGRAWALPSSAGAEAHVLARALSDGLLPQSGEDYEFFTELRATSCGAVLLAYGSAYQAGRSALNARLSGLPQEIQATLSTETLRRALARLRMETLHAADAPAGRAFAVASSHEGGPSPQALLDRWETLTAEQMDEFVRTALSPPPLEAEARQ